MNKRGVAAGKLDAACPFRRVRGHKDMASRANRPTFEAGRAPLNERLEEFGRRRLATLGDSKSGLTCHHFRSF